MKTRFVLFGHILATFAAFALMVGLATPARANTTFAKELHLSCEVCHAPGIDPNKSTLNAIGVRFLQCNYDAGCAGMTGNGGQPPAQKLSKDGGGFARFVNKTCGSTVRWVTMRHQKGTADDNIAVAVPPAQTVHVAVTQGTIFVVQCDKPSDDGNWQYVVLD